MANIYQSVIDEANAKRRQLIDRGLEPSPWLQQKIAEHKKSCAQRQAEEALTNARKKRD